MVEQIVLPKCKFEIANAVFCNKDSYGKATDSLIERNVVKGTRIYHGRQHKRNRKMTRAKQIQISKQIDIHPV